ncbi:Protease Do-like 7 [Linum grandiflorum]
MGTAQSSTAKLEFSAVNSRGEEATTEAEEWSEATKRVAAAVVAIRTTACRTFDTGLSGTCDGTGFVVDKLRGIILTNRHIVQPGPVVAAATFLNQEEIPIHPLYRDPVVHDFGFFRYDPSAIQFLNYEAIPLVPEIASVGLEIRVIGNDSGDKFSIAAGTIARLDCDAPQYGDDCYNDFNTFYIQAASGTKGGSSGSPVIEKQGRAVALNAGSRVESSSAFFLPLERVVRVLKLLQEGNESYMNIWNDVCIPRGTFQATFNYKGFNEVRRLGVKKEIEQMVRDNSPNEIGMLVVDRVGPNGPAYEHLEPGDVLIRLDGKIATNFSALESVLDDFVEQNVELQIERGGTTLTVNIKVGDLHKITPDHFLEVSGAIIHPLSYQQARNFSFPCGLVYVSNPGYILERAGVPRFAIIKKFANVETPTLKDFTETLLKLPKGARVPLEYITSNNRHRNMLALVTIEDHEWYGGARTYTRDDCSGLWNILPVIPTHKLEATTSTLSSNVEHGTKDSNNCIAPTGNDIDSDASTLFSIRSLIEPSLVMCEVSIPSVCMTDGVHDTYYTGLGVVVHHSEHLGLIVVDRNTVLISACDVLLYFASCPVQISGQVVFLHPVYNYAIVAYDPAALGADGASVVRAVQLLPDPLLRHGDSVFLVGLNEHFGAISKRATVTNPFYPIMVNSAEYPHYRARNMEVIVLDSDLGDSVPGVVCNEFGMVQAIWASFYTEIEYGNMMANQVIKGIPIYMVSQVLDQILHASNNIGPTRSLTAMPLVRLLEVEFFPRPLSRARNYGLSDYWIKALLNKDPVRKQVLRVISCSAGSKAVDHLIEGDMLLAIGGEPVTSFIDIENACRELDADDSTDAKLRLTVFRQGCEVNVDVGTDIRDGNGTRRVINWSGCILQETHSAVRALGFLPEQSTPGPGVYITTFLSGSPAERYNVCNIQWIVEVNGNATPDLDAFLVTVKGLEHDEFVRMKTVDLDGKPQVLTLKQDLRYWPTEELRFDPDATTWRRHTIKAFA